MEIISSNLIEKKININPKLFKDNNYLNSLYLIQNEIVYKNYSILYAFSKYEKKCCCIKKILINNFDNLIENRINKIINLLEENIFLIENIWIVSLNKNYIVYISEYTKNTYKNEYNIHCLNYYLNERKNVEIMKNLKLILNIIDKMIYIQKEKKFCLFNINTNNIYFNNNEKLDIYFTPCLNPYSFYNYNNSLEFNFINKILINDENSSYLNEIWSLGCIIAEMFLCITPLFNSNNEYNNLEKIINVLGIPKENDVSDFLNKNEYYSLKRLYKNQNKKVYEENDEIKIKILEIIKKCLKYNRKERISLNELKEFFVNLEKEIDKKGELKTVLKRVNKIDNLENNLEKTNLYENIQNKRNKIFNPILNNNNNITNNNETIQNINYNYHISIPNNINNNINNNNYINKKQKKNEKNNNLNSTNIKNANKNNNKNNSLDNNKIINKNDNNNNDNNLDFDYHKYIPNSNRENKKIVSTSSSKKTFFRTKTEQSLFNTPSRNHTNIKSKYISKTPSINDYILRKKAKEYENLNNKINEINNFINNMK